MPVFPLKRPDFCTDFTPPDQKAYDFTSDAGVTQTLVTQHVPSGLTFTVRYEHLTIEDTIALDDFWLETKSNNVPFQIPVGVFRQPSEKRLSLWRQNGNRNSWKFKEKYTIANGYVDVDNECSYYTTSITFVGFLDPSAPPFPPTLAELLVRSSFYHRFDSNSWISSRGGSGFNLTQVGNVTIGDRLCGSSPINKSASFNGTGYLRSINSVGGLSGDTTIQLVYRNTATATTGQYSIVGKYDINGGRSWLLWLDCEAAGQEILKLSFSADGNTATTLQTGPLSRNIPRLVTIQRSVNGGFTRFSIGNSGFISSPLIGLFTPPSVPLTIGANLNNGAIVQPFIGQIDGLGFYPEILNQVTIDFVYNGGYPGIQQV